MATVAEFILDLAKTAGVDINTPELMALAANGGLNIPFPDEAAAKVKGSLLTMASAENHPALKGHYTKQAMQAAEMELQQKLLAAGYFQPTEVQEVWGTNPLLTDKATKLVALMENKMKAAAANGGATDKQKGDIATLNAQIADLNAQILKSNNEYAQKEAALRNEFTGQMAQERTNWKKHSTLASVPITDALSGLSVQERAAMLSNLVDFELAQKQLKVVDENGVLAVKNSSNQDHYVNNQLVTYNSIVEETLKAKGLYKVNGGTPPPPAANPQAAQQNGQNQQAAQQNGQQNPTFTAHLQAMHAAVNKG